MSVAWTVDRRETRMDELSADQSVFDSVDWSVEPLAANLVDWMVS
jgi:hypothetical protein